MNDNTENRATAVVQFTTEALAVVRGAMKEEGLDNHGLRLAIVGGGCSGYAYSMDFENLERPGDEICMQDGLKIYIDAASYPMLVGSVVDYVENVHGSGFKVHNPNFKSSCSCCDGGCGDEHQAEAGEGCSCGCEEDDGHCCK